MNRFLMAAAMLASAATLQAQTRNAQPASHGQDISASAARKTLNATRLTSGSKPTIDGRIDDTVWSAAAAGVDFVQFKPNAGDAPRQKTEIRVLYDNDAMYVAARMFDTHPDSITAPLARRDNGIVSDWVMVAIDSYYDRRTAFVFALNPRGVKRDILLYDDTNDDDSWDAVWDGAARIDSIGWTAEFRIPLSQLRFSAPKDGREAVWGFNVAREIARYNEQSFWSPMKRDANAVVSLFGDVQGLTNLDAPRRMEIVPYTVSKLVRSRGDAANPFFSANDGSLGAGADLKVGVTSDLTLTATINPDFGQVEADPSVVNLTAYETFFQERRPFFVEGFDIFQAGIGVGDGDAGNDALFYTRRIGRAPHGDAPDDARFANSPTASTIIGAAKLSGKTKSGWSIGALSASTAKETAEYLTDSNVRGETTVEPFTHYGVARVIKDFDKGQSAIGGIFTAVNRDLPDNLKYLRANAYAGGLNARKRWKNGNYQLAGFWYSSYVNGDTSAINATQRSSAHNFQRPDNDYVTYDRTRTSLSGSAAGVEFFKLGGGKFRYAAALNSRTPGFEVNDLGFMPNADRTMQVAYVGYEEYKPSKYFNRWNMNINQWSFYNYSGERTGLGGNFNGSAELKNTADIWAGMNREQAGIETAALRGGPALRRPGNTNWHLGYDSNERKPVNFWLELSGNKEDGTVGRRLSVYPGMRVRASNQLELRLNPGVTWNKDAWQYVSTEGSSYVFGTLDQVTTSLTVRMSYTFSPDLSLQVYAEPFISAGDFSDFREVTNPRADKFADRFRPYTAALDNPDFNYRALRSNAVLRWEYRPGSALFLVWSQGREASGEFGNFEFSRDSRGLFRATPTNVLLIKASYWLGL